MASTSTFNTWKKPKHLKNAVPEEAEFTSFGTVFFIFRLSLAADSIILGKIGKYAIPPIGKADEIQTSQWRSV